MSDTGTAREGSRIAERLGTDGPLVGVARSVEETARRAKERAAEMKERLAKKSVGELVDDGRDFVRENPGKTILISIGVGALLGYVIGRRRS